MTCQEKYYRQLGLRERILTLPLMVAAVLNLLWRDVAGVTELTRILAEEGFLWCVPTDEGIGLFSIDAIVLVFLISIFA